MSKLIKSTEQAEISTIEGGTKVRKVFKSADLLEKEIRIAGQLDCSLPFERDEQSLIFPFCESLNSKLTSPCSPEVSSDYINRIIVILKELREKNIIHRDLKASNLYLDDSSLKLADFETVLDGESENTCGTPGIMAPEQFSKTVVDWKADQYAAGVICFRILTGCMPFEAGSPEEYMKIQSKESPDPAAVNAKLKKPLCDFLIKMLQPDPAKRYKSPADIKLAFDVACAMKKTQPVLESKTVSISGGNNRKKAVKVNQKKIIMYLVVILMALYLLSRLGSI